MAIKIEPAYPDYFWHDLVPWKHFVPVKYDLSDLVETVAFVVDPTNNELMREIAASANQWCAERLTPRELAHDMLDMLESYTHLLDRADPNWEEKWAVKKGQLLSSDSQVLFMKLDEKEDEIIEAGGKKKDESEVVAMVETAMTNLRDYGSLIQMIGMHEK